MILVIALAGSLATQTRKESAADTLPTDNHCSSPAGRDGAVHRRADLRTVIRESGIDRSAVTGGTKVVFDRIVVRITAAEGPSFLDRRIALVEGSARQKRRTRSR
jgi:K+-transporting ATPase ATPase B chain